MAPSSREKALGAFSHGKRSEPRRHQKNHMAIYMDETNRDHFFEEYKAAGKRLDIGKSCVRFRKLDDLPLDLIGRAIAAMPAADFVTRVKALHARKS